MKRWYQSKTIWFNAVSAFVLLLTELSMVLDAFPVASPVVDQVQAWIPLFIVMGNAGLRFITDKAVSW